MPIIRVAGHLIRLEAEDDYALSRCAAFLAEGEPEATFSVSTAHLADAMRSYRADSPEEMRFACLATQFYLWLLERDAFCLHASALCREGRAYLFCAASGVGKSTHARMWAQAFGDEALTLDDDKPILLLTERGWQASGTPWCGKEGLSRSLTAPLQGICLLQRGRKNDIVRLTPDEALPKLFEQTPKPPDERRMSSLLALLDSLLRRAPVWRLCCTPTTDAAELAWQQMKPASAGKAEDIG